MTISIEELVLDHGAHGSPEAGMCIMEAVAYVAGEKFSDHPKCASPILGSLLRNMNDRLGKEKRQLLKPYIPLLIGTNTGPADEETRRWMLCDWLVHEYAPAMFRASGLVAEAERFEQLAAITSSGEWAAARETIYDMRDKAWARRRDAVAVAAAVADAAAVAAAAADAVADAVADAAAVAAAAAAAVAAAVAAADAVADAPFKQASEAAAKVTGYTAKWHAAHKVLRPHYDAFYKEKLADIAPGLGQSALLLIDRLIDVSKVSA